LIWQSISGANSYKIYRDLDPRFTPGPGNLINTVSETTFTDTNALGLPLGKYFYIVTASSENAVMGSVSPTPPLSRKSQQTDQSHSLENIHRR